MESELMVDCVVIGLKEGPFSERCIKTALATTDVPIRIIKSFGGSIAENLNRGFAQVESDVFGFFQDDWEFVDNQWASRLLKKLDGHNYVAAKQLYPDGKIHCAWFQMKFRPNDFYIKLVGNGEDGMEHRYSAEKHGVPVFIRSDRYREIGGQDEGFKGEQHEEVDLCIRLGNPLYVGDVSIIHHFSENPETQAVKKLNIKENLKLLLAKHGDKKEL